ncbi:hypothetical protein [Streptomyces sp. NPDC014733]|uniref:hypothetical protein n=1 Tax=Streptomyces sp. NPDC014733 TaxID=3364885 RepID=UPI0036F8BFF1
MAGSGRLKAAVYVQDPATREVVVLVPGARPAPELAALITNPHAWEEPPEDAGAVPIAVGEPDPAGPPQPGAGGGRKGTGARRRPAAAES